MTTRRRLQNSKGTVYYGMHFYPGVAEYKDKGDVFRVFLNENTIRNMGPTFAGKPVFVDHVDEVSDDLDTLRAEADGWVLKSFFNEADGKHWCEFIVVSEKGEKAIQSGYRLSNCYVPNEFDRGGEWNGVAYQKEVTGGEYEHLAIVPNPRYEESVIMTPEQFKAYNESKRLELQRLANDKGGTDVKLNLFKRQKVENAADIENVVVVLPKSGREVAITTLVNEADAAEEKKKLPQFANDDDKVKVGEKEMTVKELANAFLERCAKDDVENDDDDVENDDDGDVENDDDDIDAEMDNDVDEDEDAKKAAKAIVKHEEKEIEDAKRKNAKAAAKKKADAVRNAYQRGNYEDVATKTFDPTGGVERGKSRYGT